MIGSITNGFYKFPDENYSVKLSEVQELYISVTTTQNGSLVNNVIVFVMKNGKEISLELCTEKEAETEYGEILEQL